MNKVIGIFRKGTTRFECNTNYRVADSVSNDCLEKLFAMKVRDMLLIHAAKREMPYKEMKPSDLWTVHEDEQLE